MREQIKKILESKLGDCSHKDYFMEIEDEIFNLIESIRQEERKNIAQRAEEIIQEERFSGTPNAMNKLIKELKVVN